MLEKCSHKRKVEVWEAKLEDARSCRQHMYDYLVDALQLFPVDKGQFHIAHIALE